MDLGCVGGTLGHSSPEEKKGRFRRHKISFPCNQATNILGGHESRVFPIHVMGPTKRHVGSPRLHLVLEERSPTVSKAGKRRLVKSKNNQIDQKSKKKRGKTREARRK